MITAQEWLSEAGGRGFGFMAGVPCSYLTPFINGAINAQDLLYVGATSEGEAVGLCCGAWLAGTSSVAMCQNSGLGNMVNPLTSLSWTFRIPHLVVTTWRGRPGLHDEPQHELMGRMTEKLLDLLELPHELFPSEASKLASALDRAEALMASSGRPFVFLMRKGSVAPESLQLRPARDRGAFPAQRVERFPALEQPELSRREALALAVESLGPRFAFLGTTGKLGRELFSLGDRPGFFFHVGAMGCVSAVGHGVALCRPQQPVAVLDGDGSLLMKLGTLASIGHEAPRNLLHLVFDNEQHESTGGQATASSTVDFAAAAVAAGYRQAFQVARKRDLEELLPRVGSLPGPSLVHIKVAVATDPELGRPTIHPSQVARRFREWLAGGSGVS